MNPWEAEINVHFKTAPARKTRKRVLHCSVLLKKAHGCFVGDTCSGARGAHAITI